MQHWKESVKHSYIHPVIGDILCAGDLFVDIETTGLSRARNPIYLIGAAAAAGDGSFVVHQFFADTQAQESDILASFADYLSAGSFRRVITFNGTRFDLPYLTHRAARYGITLPLEQPEHLDIYKELVLRKELFQLQNYRQKTVEEFLQLHRDDKYNGGELIRVYLDYEKQPDETRLQLLKLHNYEDVLGMIDLLAIFAYDKMFAEPPVIANAAVCTYNDLGGAVDQELIVTLTPPRPLPGILSSRQPLSGIYLRSSADGSSLRLRIPLYDGMARLYYADYKNYEYLPEEDMAIHKSLSACVDPAHKQKATPETCYTRVAVTDDFLHSTQLAQYVSHMLSGYCFSKKNDLFRR